jgi:leader peptidase (prepilin peptidase)/N-methyltransferase
MEFSEITLAILCALLGILAGAVINALADDLPHSRRPRLPHYPNGVPRPVMAWSGLLAFLSGQREGTSIEYAPEEEKRLGLSLSEIADLAYDTVLSWRHPLTELGLAALFAFVAVYHAGESRIPIWLFFLSILALVSIIDLEHRLVLYEVVIPSVILVLILNGLFPENTPDGQRTFEDYLWGAGVGGCLFFIFYLGGELFGRVIGFIRGQPLSEVAFGFGDVLLGFLCGAMIAWQGMLFATIITVFVGAAGSILYIFWRLLTRQRYSAYTPLPYGPYIVIGTVIMMLFLEEARDFLMR